LLTARLLKRQKGTIVAKPDSLPGVRKKATPNKNKTPFKTTSLMTVLHDDSVPQLPLFQEDILDTMKSVPTDASNIAYTQNSDNTTSLEFVTPQTKKRVINTDDMVLDNEDSINVDVLAKIVVAKPQIDKTQDLVLP
jgi:hypothetical protein